MNRNLIYILFLILICNRITAQNQDTTNLSHIITIVQDNRTSSSTLISLDSTKTIFPAPPIDSTSLDSIDSISTISVDTTSISTIDSTSALPAVSTTLTTSDSIILKINIEDSLNAQKKLLTNLPFQMLSRDSILSDSMIHNLDSLKIVELQDSLILMKSHIAHLADSLDQFLNEKLVPKDVEKKVNPLLSDKDNLKNPLSAIDIKTLKVDSLILTKPKRRIIDTLRFGPWKLDILAMLTGNQYYYKNWNAGGENSISLSLLFKFGFNYTKKRNSWSNLLTVNYGSMWLYKDERFNKTDDIFSFTTNYAYNIKGAWSFSFTGTFLTQFDKAYSADLKSITSNFMAPGYLTTSLGFEYKFKNKKNDFKITYAPITGKTTFVLVDTTQTKDKKDSTVNMAIKGVNFGIREGQNVGSTLGSLLTISYKVNIIPQISLSYFGQVFYGYFKTNQYKNVPDVNMNMSINFKITKHIQATLYLGMIYDYKVRFNRIDAEGKDILDSNGKIMTTDKVQFKETFGLSLTYKI